jgi:hypothetical protein
MRYTNEELERFIEQPSDEPTCNFPLAYYEQFLIEIKRLGVSIITYDDLLKGSDDWQYQSFYPQEYKSWKIRNKHSDRPFLLIQHDVDNHPSFTKRMVALEILYGIRSNIFIFRNRYANSGVDESYVIDHDFFRWAEELGYVIGYHQNALALADFNVPRAAEMYRDDVIFLRRLYNIDYVVPHGGAGKIVNGKMLHNVDLPMPEEFHGNLRWVFNRYGLRFEKKWSDGGLRKARDMKRIAGLDIINQFLHTFKSGERYFCLVHPQRWGYNIDINQNPLLAKESWYLEICKKYNRVNMRA